MRIPSGGNGFGDIWGKILSARENSEGGHDLDAPPSILEIGDGTIKIEIVKVDPVTGKVKLGIFAPPGTPIEKTE